MATNGRRRSFSSDEEEGASGFTYARRPSFEDEDSDEERAKEIEGLKARGILPPEFEAESKYDEDDVSKEIAELLARGAITQEQADSLRTAQDNRQIANVLSENDESSELQPSALDSEGIPENWKKKRHSSELLPRVELRPGQTEYDKIVEEFRNTKITVTKIERLQNVRLLDRFKNEMEHIKKHRSRGFKLNVRYLYHGTNVDKSKIFEEGLDQRLSRMGYFGRGIYFSDNPQKCAHYSSGASTPEEAVILKCRVILGDSKAYAEGCYDATLKREPEKENPTDNWGYYDSVMGRPKDFNEYVVYENRRVMVEYMISFQLDPDLIAKLRKANAPAKKSSAGGGQQDDYAVLTDEEHFQRIAEVREAVRKKRLMEQGKTYITPDTEQAKRDREMWVRLQKMHGVQPSVLNEKKTAFVSQNSAAGKTIPSSPNTTSSSKLSGATGFTRSVSNDSDTRTSLFEKNPIEEVLEVCVAEFVAVTNVDDSEIAKYYVQRAEMDVNQAILQYYEEQS